MYSLTPSGKNAASSSVDEAYIFLQKHNIREYHHNFSLLNMVVLYFVRRVSQGLPVGYRHLLLTPTHLSLCHWFRTPPSAGDVNVQWPHKKQSI